MLNKAMLKTRLTQNTKAKQKQEREREKVTESLGAIFFPHLGRTFPFSKPLIFKFERDMRSLRRSPRGVKKDVS